MEIDDPETALGDDEACREQPEQQEQPEVSTDEAVVAEEPASPEENGGNDREDEDASGQSPATPSEMAMEEFRRAASTQLESGESVSPSSDLTRDGEFSLLVVLQPDNVRHHVTVTSETTLEALREMLCRDLQLDAERVSFPDLRGARAIGQKEAELPLSAYGLYSNSESECVLEAFVARPPVTSDYVMPDRIQVQLYNGELFLRSFSSDVFLPMAYSCLMTRSLQTKRESGTQMTRRDLKLDDSCSRHVSARPYFDSYQLDSLREDSVLLLQRHWRGFRARLYVFNIREQRRRVAFLAAVEEQEDETEDASRQRREVNRRMNPKTVSDFEVLYNELDKWRQVEGRKVREQRDLNPSERQQALDAILAKETKLLQTIDRLKLTATDSNRKQRVESMLQFMARPKQWQMSDGGVKEVHTPFTVRAKELMDLHHGLRTPLGSVDERLDMLLHVKWTAQEFDCALTRELVELIDREADMLSRGRKEKSLEGLRKRLANLFLQFIETPEFNPEAAALKHAQTQSDDISHREEADSKPSEQLRSTMPGYEAEETIKRIKSHKGVQAVLIVNQEGVPIYSSTSDEEFALDHAALISQLAAKAKSTIRTLDPTNDMTFLRIRSKKHEIMIAPGTADWIIVGLLATLLTNVLDAFCCVHPLTNRLCGFWMWKF
ncbi:hypothetical protein BBJ28_00012507 [Nothophytophthora sp. Chile5]|nr:hypothetical protein BBJ28_00012507 [Nothophytophthora sp. Chile5]